MSIKFHCEHCGKKINAPDDAGGKRGKCPSCGQKIFVPAPEGELEEIPIAAENPTEEKQRQELRKQRLTEQEALTDHKEAVNAPDSREQTIPDTSLPIDDNGVIDSISTEDKIKQYIVVMSRGELDEAERLETEIVKEGEKAKQLVETLAVQDFIHPELQDFPQSVISGFFKKLLAKL